MKCLACGSTALVRGTLIDKSSGGKPLFRIDEIPVWKRIFGAGGRTIRAYGCVHCQNLQFAVDFTEDDLMKYQQFDGEQPGVLERLGSDTDKQE